MSLVRFRNLAQFCVSRSLTAKMVLAAFLLIGAAWASPLWARSPVEVVRPATPVAADEPSLPRVFLEDFESGAEHWQPLDPTHWKVKETAGRRVYSHFVKQGKYQPPHRSPVNIALRKDDAVTDFVFTAKVLSTHPDYGHRDAVLVFGYQDPAHFYYVHLGKQMDDHANQIFIVNGKPRTKISTTTTAGTPWDDQWHTVRVERTTADGAIRVYYDDLQKPVMTATDKTFVWGRVGIGSFDDTTDWDDLELRGVKHP